MNRVKISLKGIKAIIFDMDGTMVDNTKYHELSWYKFGEKYGVKITKEDFENKLVGKRNEVSLEIIFGKKLPKDKAKELADYKEHAYRELYAPVFKEVQGLTKLIKTFKQKKLKVAVATNSPEKNRQFVLKNLKIEDEFDLVLGEEHVTHGKPHPEIYLKTAKKLKIDPAKCLVFEDSPSGVEAAKKAGMKVIAVLTSHTKDQLKDADYEIEHFKQIELTYT